MSKVIERKPIGQIHLGDVNEASVCYTLKYLQKPKKIKKNDKTGRYPEFSIMSKGLGSQYIRSQMVDWHKNKTASRVYVALDGNKKGCMPRYYKDKIYSTEDKTKISEQRCIDLELKAKHVADVSLYQYKYNQGKAAAYRKMLQKDTKNKI